jgi:hypothetical protein
MQKIPLRHAKPGMVLAKAVENDRGMTLYGAGTELTENAIARLSAMEVQKITVEGHPVDTGDGGRNLEQEVEALRFRFRKVGRDPLMQKVQSAFLEVLREGAEEE